LKILQNTTYGIDCFLGTDGEIPLGEEIIKLFKRAFNLEIKIIKHPFF
jgi:hypothetical protein